MKLLTFRIQGKMAHFRRYYSNSSALSYSIPPRTTIAGMIAGLLGYERDSYYKLFSLDQCKIALANLSSIKKETQKMNLLMIKDLKDFNGSKEHHSQTPTEFVMPQNIRTGILDYKLWFFHEDSKIMEHLQEVLSRYEIGYGSNGISLALGTAAQLGWVYYEGIQEGQEILSEQKVEISSVTPLRYIERLEMEAEESRQYRLVKEDIPLEFDTERRITKSGKGYMVINLLSKPIRATVQKHVIVDDGTKIIWME